MLELFLAGVLGGLTSLVIAGALLGVAINAAKTRMRSIHKRAQTADVMPASDARVPRS